MNKLTKYRRYFGVIFLIGFVIYFPIFFNGFAWDDIAFIVNNPQVHQIDLPSLLGKNMFNSGLFYRPIPAIYFATIDSLFGAHAFYFHVIQLALHLIGVCLLFIFFCQFFKKEISFFLALVFLVHPINVESVAFIGATQSEIYFIPGILALILAQRQKLSRTRLIWISILLILSVFTKETGILFYLLVLISRYLFKLNKIKKFALLGLCIGGIYLFFRIFIAGVLFSKAPNVAITTLPLMERLIQIPAIITYYLKTFFYPINLSILQHWTIKTISLENFFIPLFACIGLFLSFLYIALVLYKKAVQQSSIPLVQFQNKHKRTLHIAKTDDSWKHYRSFLFFLLWFVIGMSLILQIIPLDMTVADRWFYFPIVGLLGIIGVGLQTMQGSYTHHRKVYICIAIILLSLFSLRTFVRTSDWKDTLTILGHDIKEQNDNYMMLNYYATQLYYAGKLDEAIYYKKKYVTAFPDKVDSVHELGTYYHENRQYSEALSIYNRTIELYTTKYQNKKSVIPYRNKVLVLKQLGRDKDAVDFIKNVALKEFPNDSQLYVMLAITELDLGDRKAALGAIKDAHTLAPNDPKIYQFYLHLNNQQIK